MLHWITFFPDWFGLLFFVFVPAALAVAVHAALRERVKAESLLPHHDVAGFLVAIVGVLYAVVLGFVVVTVWSNFDEVQRTADIEAGDVGDAYAFATMLPDRPRSRVQLMLANYALEVRDREWPLLRIGRPDPAARNYLASAFLAIAQTPGPPVANVSDALRAQSTRESVITLMREIADNRRLRLIEAGDKLPPALYVALLIGACIVLGFVFLFGVESAALQFTMTALVAGCIGLLLGVIVEFNSPYRGAIRVSPEAWDAVITNFGMDRVQRVEPPQLRVAP